MDTRKVYGEFPDGFRMTYQDLWDAGSPLDMEVHLKAIAKLVAEHGGDPKMFWSAEGITA